MFHANWMWVNKFSHSHFEKLFSWGLLKMILIRDPPTNPPPTHSVEAVPTNPLTQTWLSVVLEGFISYRKYMYVTLLSISGLKKVVEMWRRARHLHVLKFEAKRTVSASRRGSWKWVRMCPRKAYKCVIWHRCKENTYCSDFCKENTWSIFSEMYTIFN